MMDFSLQNILFIIFLFSSCFLAAQNDRSRKYLVEGNKNYLSLSYDEAAANYLRAIQEGENSFKSNFNLGNAMYKLRKFDDAIFQYEKSIKLSNNAEQHSNAYFNIGDSYYQKGEYAKAAESFKRALKLNPEDEMARYNYMLAKQKLEQQQDREELNEKNNEDAQNEKGKDPDQDNSEKQPQDNSESQGEDSKNNIQQGQSGGTGDLQYGQGDGKEEGQKSIKDEKSLDNTVSLDKMQKQYYEGVLGAMEEQEKRAHQKIINKRIPSSRNREPKDW